MKLRHFFSLLVVATAAAITGCGATGGYNLPPASRLMEPGPGVGGPGPGVMTMPGPGAPRGVGARGPGGLAGGPGMGGSVRFAGGPNMIGPRRLPGGPQMAGPRGPMGPMGAPGMPGMPGMPGPGMPGMPGMPGPGMPGMRGMPGGVMQASAIGPAGCETPMLGGGAGAGGGAIVGAMQAMEVQVLFARPEAMQVSFGTGGNSFVAAPMITPARQNFMQGGIYRLKITGLPDREGTELYPTLEVGPPTRLTAAYLAHNAIPIQFTEEDFDQVLSGNFVTKVIYLPEPEFQELALAGVETLVSTRLDPGLDPIVEADRRGSILAVVRIGNKDMEVPAGEPVDPMIAKAGQGVVPAAHNGVTMNMSGDGVAQVGFACNTCGPGGVAPGIGDQTGGLMVGPTSPRGGYGPGGMPPGLMGAGQYGMPITGTPIGLPGPPHVPLGVPAGLKKHVMHNWTSRHIPDPVSKLKINVKQRPGLSYPQPPSRAWVVEDTIHSAPHYSHHKPADPCAEGNCGHLHHGGGLLGRLKRKLHH